MSFWIGFFKDAGIPAGDAANYAVVFTDNRISRTMLLDLSKEYLKDMGISILGDVISILKHAKTVFSQDARDRALQDTRGSPAQELAALKKSTPASRTIGHYIGTDRSLSPSVTSPKISKELSARLGSPVTASENMRIQKITITPSPTAKEEVPVPRKRRVYPEHEGKYKISMPAGTTEKTRKILELQRQQAEQQRIKAEEEKKRQQGQLSTSVFSRLGSEKPKATSTSQPTITITGLGNINLSAGTQSSVFNRLGGKTTVKRPATSTVTFEDDEEEEEEIGTPQLEYAGVLKASPTKRAKIDVAKKLTKAAHKTLMSKPAVTVATAGVLAGQTEQKNVKLRLGPKSAEVSSTTQATPSSRKGVQVNGTKKDMITIRVDTTTSNTATTSGVFSRLGKQKS